MSSIDLLLNFAGLLLWLAWRSYALDPLRRSTPATLVGTLKRAEPYRFRRWQILAGLSLLLILRGVLYWQVGPAADWTPKLDLLIVVLPFRIDFAGVAILYSFASFLRALAVLYCWFLALAFVNHGIEETDPLHKLVRLQLGRVSRLPRALQALFPLISVTIAWAVLHPLFVRAGVITPAESWVNLLGQGLLVGAALYLSVKYLFPILLLAHLVISYVYVGRSPIWDYVSATAQRLLKPIRRLPLRFARIDFAPLLAAVIILLLLDALPKYLLLKAARSGGHLWPQ